MHLDNVLYEELIEAELLSENIGKCEGQCQRDGVILTEHECRGHYVDRPITPVYKLCFHCAVEFHEYWDSLWSDYYSSVL
jgi:hypothetical protein